MYIFRFGSKPNESTGTQRQRRRQQRRTRRRWYMSLYVLYTPKTTHGCTLMMTISEIKKSQDWWNSSVRSNDIYMNKTIAAFGARTTCADDAEKTTETAQSF